LAGLDRLRRRFAGFGGMATQGHVVNRKRVQRLMRQAV
jgi:hypothetical protein